jgi:CheY-like chemotaxis protein
MLKSGTSAQYILLVEDESDILDLFCECLQSLGYKIVCFDNPIKVLNYLEMKEDDEENILAKCSLLITDYKMPQMSGIDLIKKIKEKDTTFKLKIILISAFIKSDIISKDISNSLRIDKIIEKPIPLKNLKDEVMILLSN